MIALPDLEAFLPGETAPSAAARPASQKKKKPQPLRRPILHSLRLRRLPRDYRAGDEPNRG